MKKIILIPLLYLLSFQLVSASASKIERTSSAKGTIDQETQNLVVLGKIWGLLKYHHPSIIKGEFNWDQELIKFLPNYKLINNVKQRNEALFNWIKSFGPVVPSQAPPDSLTINVKLKPDYSWIDNSNLSPELSKFLLQISKCYSNEDQHYIKYLADDNVVIPSFVNEDSYAQMAYPDTNYRILAVYRYWNIIEYWYPYRYLTKQNWQNCLGTLINDAIAARDESAYDRFIQKMIAGIKDSHAVVNSRKIEEIKGKWLMPFTLKFIENEPVITSVDIANLNGAAVEIGDILKKINGVPVNRLVQELAPYVSASNNAVTLRVISQLLNRSTDSVSTITITNKQGTTSMQTIKNVKFTMSAIKPVYDFTYQRDSSCFLLPSGVIYVNAGKFRENEINWVKDHLGNAKGLVLDARQYPKTGAGAVFSLLQDCLLENRREMCKFSSVVKGYPGLFRFVAPFNVGKVNLNYYKGKVAILVNEQTQSTSEFLVMGYQLAPRAYVIGSTTAGADGNVTYPFWLPGGIVTYMTGIGVYYPDGGETQQIGIVPNIKVTETIVAYRNHKDEILEKAISVLTGK